MSSKQPVNILLVDDQPAKLMSYEAILGALEENLIKASSGREALEHLLRSEIAVVLVDVCMPELDGFELATMIRSHPRFQRTAIILVSGVLVEDVDRLKGYDSGAVDYVSVPIVPEILRAKVSVFADLFRKTVELERWNKELERRVAARTAELETSAALLRQNQERLRLVLTAGGIWGWTWDVLTREFVWEKPHGRPEPVPQTFSEFIDGVHPDDRASVQEAFRRAVAGEGDYQAEFRSLFEGTQQWWLGRGTLTRDSSGRPLSIAGISMDITARKRAEEERAVLLQNAEDARRESEKANRLKDEFLATLSHELRAPLNAITGWAHMLRQGELDAAAQTKALEAIERNALLQARLVSDLLDVSRIVSGKLRLEIKTLDLATVVRAAAESIRPTAQAKNIRMETALVGISSPVSGDAARLQQVVSNLLSNAVKFTPEGGHVEIRLEDLGPQAELTITDDGPGIRAEFLPYIFDRFRQGDTSTTRTQQGLGLGLAIVRHVVELHGGQVEAANRTDRSGAIFTVLLPTIARTAAGAPPSVARGSVPLTQKDVQDLPPTSPLEGIRVLVVEDEADSREVVAMVLEHAGAEVRVAASVSEALPILRRELPDVLVADIEMPGQDGYSLVLEVRNWQPERGGTIPSIALTAHAGAADRAKLLDAGFDRHLPKPVQPPDLIAAVAYLAHSKIMKQRMREEDAALPAPAPGTPSPVSVCDVGSETKRKN